MRVSLSLLVIFKLTIFTILRLYMACKMWKITALTWKISNWRLVEKFHISSFPMYYSVFNLIREHEITKLRKKKKKKFVSDLEKKDTKTSKKRHEWNGMTQRDYLIFSEMRMRKRHLFCTSSHHCVPHEKQQECNKGSEPWNQWPC
mgnify:CR=1 FL=1